VKGYRKNRAQSTEHRVQNTEHRAQTSKNRFQLELQEIENSGLLRKTTCLESSNGSRISIKGKTYVNFASNDYLNLTGHREIVQAAVRGLRKYGFGSGASRLLSGTYSPHKKLEERIAKYKKTQAAIAFNTGYAANTGVIPALTDAASVIFSDELNHASIVDGTRLSKADVKIYRHRDMNHLESLLRRTRSNNKIKRRLIVTDTVFSMDGDIAPVNDIAVLSEQYEALLMIDDAHGTGVLGKSGRGGLEHFNIAPGDIIQMGTFSKAAGCFGAFVAGTRELVNLLINRARSFIYSTSLPPSACEAAVTALDILERKSGNLRKRLWKNRDLLCDGLKEAGFNIMDSETPIVPVFMGSEDNALKTARRLYRNNIFAPAIRPPSVPLGKCRIRFSVTAGQTDDDIVRVIEIMRNMR
jgi:8-amino-7-oxononanoate synthase